MSDDWSIPERSLVRRLIITPIRARARQSDGRVPGLPLYESKEEEAWARETETELVAVISRALARRRQQLVAERAKAARRISKQRRCAAARLLHTYSLNSLATPRLVDSYGAVSVPLDALSLRVTPGGVLRLKAHPKDDNARVQFLDYVPKDKEFVAGRGSRRLKLYAPVDAVGPAKVGRVQSLGFLAAHALVKHWDKLTPASQRAVCQTVFRLPEA